MANRLSRHLIWKRGDAPPEPDGGYFEAETFAPIPAQGVDASVEILHLDVYKAARERAVYLLTIGAEVEHALMVQYLFAAWSLGGPHLCDPKEIELARSWRATILEIAREEMGHLATVENLLTLIGGALSFAREEYPSPTNLYPFDFELEPLTRSALAKYVLAEMPSDAIVDKLELTDEINAIRARVGAQGLKVHRTGKLYDAIANLFTARPVFPAATSRKTKAFIAAADIQADSVSFMVRSAEWGLGYDDLLILAPASRQDAIDAIKNISDQGEGTGITKDSHQSHFGKFLQIYREFPEEGWMPSRRLAKNPTADRGNRNGTRICNPAAYKWARLFNLRYRMLLMYLAHSFAIEGGTSQSGRNPRGLLITWTFGEMYNLRSIAEILMGLPIRDGSKELAGPPFDMPSTLDLALRESDRWRLHRDLIVASQHYVDELLGCGAGTGHQVYLRGLRSANSSALEQSIAMVGA